MRLQLLKSPAVESGAGSKTDRSPRGSDDPSYPLERPDRQQRCGGRHLGRLHSKSGSNFLRAQTPDHEADASEADKERHPSRRFWDAGNVAIQCSPARERVSGG